MAAYTRLNIEDIQKILSFYGLPPLLGAAPLSLGISNSNYRCDLEDKRSVILKVSNDKGVAEMKEEQDILLALKDYPHSLAPYKTSQGEGVYEWKDLYGAVFPFVEGSKPMGSVQEVFQVGEALGALHAFGQERGLENSGLRPHGKVGFDLEGVLRYAENEGALPDFKQACSELLDSSARNLWRESSLPVGLIHGDLYLDNTLFKGGRLSAILDFEQAGVGAFLQDVGIAVSGSCLDKEGVSMEKVTAFVEGYEKRRPLEAVERKLLNFSIVLGFLDISLWRIKRFYEGNLDPLKKESYKELLELARSFCRS